MLKEMTTMNELDQLGLEVKNSVSFPQYYASCFDGIISPLIIVFFILCIFTYSFYHFIFFDRRFMISS